ncbi:uncharacterized protein BDV17DRAFT_285132 [Aspergillus undulatus]|uniref:uncharacterized protein n=1 Tax=Aspergillus undulatus TaxID=1810928 RepID=UPI003CCE16E2
MLMAKSSDRADRWRNWALKETMRWMDNPRGCMPPISREFRETSTAPECDCESTTKNEYFSDSAPGLSDSPGTTPGSEGIRDPPTPPTSPTPTPVGRGLVINKHTRKQTNALRAPEEEASWEDATTKPTARALFINHDQRPSGKRRTLLRAEDPAFHVSLTEGRSKNNEDQHKESSLEEKDSIQGILSAGIDKKVREVLARVVTEIQVTNAGSLKASGTIYLLSLESAKGFYRICCWSGNKVLSPEKGCYDKATPFHDIPNYMAVKKLLLAEFGVPPPDRKCERCSKTHRDWTKVSDQDVNVNTSREESVNVRCLDVHDHNCELSKGPDRWRCGRDKVVEMQKDETAVEDVPTNIPPSKTPVAVDLEPRSTPEGRTNGRFGGLGGMMGKPTVSTEQQAPGLLDIGIATVRNIFNGLF